MLDLGTKPVVQPWGGKAGAVSNREETGSHSSYFSSPRRPGHVREKQEATDSTLKPVGEAAGEFRVVREVRIV